MGFRSFRTVGQSLTVDGKSSIASFRRVASQATVQGGWCDLSMASGNPTPNYYASAPLVSALFDKKDFIYHGPDVPSDKKKLHRLTMIASGANAAPCTFILCDFLLYYPFIDCDAAGEIQLLENTVTLPRYDGAGVQAMLVAQGSYIGGGSFSIEYTNEHGVGGRTSQVQTSNSTTLTSSLMTSGPGGAGRLGPYIGLQSGDHGIRSVESVTFSTANGGIAALVLVKPLATMVVREITAAAERDFFLDFASAPEIRDGACLNFIGLPNASLAAVPIIGTLETTWGNDGL